MLMKNTEIISRYERNYAALSDKFSVLLNLLEMKCLRYLIPIPMTFLVATLLISMLQRPGFLFFHLRINFKYVPGLK